MEIQIANLLRLASGDGCSLSIQRNYTLPLHIPAINGIGFHFPEINSVWSISVQIGAIPGSKLVAGAKQNFTPAVANGHAETTGAVHNNQEGIICIWPFKVWCKCIWRIKLQARPYPYKCFCG